MGTQLTGRLGGTATRDCTVTIYLFSEQFSAPKQFMSSMAKQKNHAASINFIQSLQYYNKKLKLLPPKW
jgi:hypothetical protein